MSMGLGHRYWVRMIRHFTGTLEEVIKYMKDNPPRSDKEWYELSPIVNIKQGTCNEYMCDLVEIDNIKRRR